MNFALLTNTSFGEWTIELVIKIKIPIWLERILVFPVLLYRKARYGYPFRRIPLTQGKYAIVDPDDFYHLCKYKWFACKNASTFYAKRNVRLSENLNTKSIAMHRQIMKPPPGFLIDHINYNGLDNRKANLRLATHRQNTLHVIRTMNPGTSKYKGVCWYNRERKWVVRITANGKTYRLGYFDDEIQAAKTYDKAAKKYHGQFAALNFPEQS